MLDAVTVWVGASDPLRVRGRRRARSRGRQRFLMTEKAEANHPSHLNLVQNWFEELKARVPTK
jgi:hypothetical protein